MFIVPEHNISCSNLAPFTAYHIYTNIAVIASINTFNIYCKCLFIYKLMPFVLFMFKFKSDRVSLKQNLFFKIVWSILTF